MEGRRPRDHRTTDHKTTGLRTTDYGTTGLRDYGTTGPQDHRTRITLRSGFRATQEIPKRMGHTNVGLGKMGIEHEDEDEE
jgi:hypothetical protein